MYCDIIQTGLFFTIEGKPDQTFFELVQFFFLNARKRSETILEIFFFNFLRMCGISVILNN